MKPKTEESKKADEASYDLVLGGFKARGPRAMDRLTFLVVLGVVAFAIVLILNPVPTAGVAVVTWIFRKIRKQQ